MDADRNPQSDAAEDRPLFWLSDRNIPREEANRYFFATTVWRDVVERDLGMPGAINPRIAVAVSLPWPDIAHAARAAALFDLELRHMCLAFEAVRGELMPSSSLFELTDLEVPSGLPRDGSLARVLGARLVKPPRGLVESLETVAAEGPPIDLLLEPPERLGALLCALPVSSLVFACSSFGQKMRLTRYSGAPLSGARYSSARETLRVLQAIRDGTWEGPRDDLQASYQELLGRPGLFRAVSPLRGAGASGFRATVYRGDVDSEVDLVASIELLEERSSVEDYKKVLPLNRWSTGTSWLSEPTLDD